MKLERTLYSGRIRGETATGRTWFPQGPSMAAFVCVCLFLVPVSAVAGGFDRGGVDIDLLFDDHAFALEVGLTHVVPKRELRSVQRQATLTDLIAPGSGIPPLSSNRVNVEGDFTVPRVGAKLRLVDAVDCLVTFTEPYGADAAYGAGSAYSPTSVRFAIESLDYGLTCSYAFALPKFSVRGFEIEGSRVRLIGGFSYLELEGRQTRQSFLDLAALPPAGLPVNPLGIARFALEDETFGGRVGIAFEIPKIAFRAVALYNTRYDLDGLSGDVDLSGFAGPVGGLVSVDAETEIPQSFELRFQTGIAPKTLAFANFKWQEWSELGVIPINGVVSPLGTGPTPTSFDPLYRDGYSVEVGVGRQVRHDLSALFAISWDRGTSQSFGSQTDSWVFSFGGGYQIHPNVQLRLGGAVGVLVSGNSAPSGGDAANAITYSFDDDLFGAISTSVKVTFGESNRPGDPMAEDDMPEAMPKQRNTF